MKKFIYFALYFSEGAPIGFIWWALPAMLAERGWAISDITQITALATLPWSLKFIFSPVIEFLDLKKIPIKNQLIFYQLMMGVTCFLFGQEIIQDRHDSLSILIFLHALFAAAQDICIDTLAIKNIAEDELGTVNGLMQAGMLIGRSLFGGVTMLLVHSLGLELVFIILALSIWSTIIFATFIPKSNATEQGIDFHSYLQLLKSFFLKKRNWILLLLTYLAGYSFEGLAAILSATLVKVGLSTNVRTLIYSLLVPLAMGVGALAGGKYADKIHKPRAFFRFLVTNAISAVTLAFFIDMQWIVLIQIAVIFFYFTIGLHIASLYSFLMEQTDKRIAAFQFSLMMAMTNLAESNSAFLAGHLTQQWSYFSISLLLASLGLISLFPLSWVTKKSLPKKEGLA